MNNNIIIACKILQNELEMAVDLAGKEYPIIWIDADYHNDPEKLRTRLQSEIDRLKNVDNILFSYGCCGNGLVGLKATTANLIIPKTDDCISMLLSRPAERAERPKDTYFLTKGWLDSAENIINEYLYTVKKYGLKRAKRLYKIMLKHYNNLMLIDTGAYKLKEALPKAEDFAEKTDLKLIIKKGNLWLLQKLLTGPHDNNFCVIPKGSTVSLDDFGYDCIEQVHHQGHINIS